MNSEKKPLLPINTNNTNNNNNEKIQSKEKEPIMNIEMAYPLYENGKCKWFFISLWRHFIFSICLLSMVFFNVYSSYYIIRPFSYGPIIGIIVEFIRFSFTILFYLIILLPVSYISGSFDYFYLLSCQHNWYRYILPNDYVFNRMALSKSTVTASHPYCYKDDQIVEK
ncbi:unnamed protein product [Cunninghamella blakesleeana]